MENLTLPQKLLCLCYWKGIQQFTAQLFTSIFSLLKLCVCVESIVLGNAFPTKINIIPCATPSVHGDTPGQARSAAYMTWCVVLSGPRLCLWWWSEQWKCNCYWSLTFCTTKALTDHATNPSIQMWFVKPL